MTIKTINGALIVFKARCRELRELRDKLDEYNSPRIQNRYDGMVAAYTEVMTFHD